MILATLQFEGIQHGWMWVLLVTLGAAFMAWTYREIFVRTQRRLTWALLGLRLVGLLALLLALAKPTWTAENDLVDPGHLAVVLDDSRSMSLEGRYARAQTGVDRLRQELQTGNPGTPLTVDLFDISGEPAKAGLPSQPRTERTDLVQAVTKAIGQLRSQLLVGVVVVSDGVDNTGRQDTVELSESPVPIYGVGFSSDAEAARLDLELSQVQAPERVMVNNQTDVQITIAKSAGPAVTATVAIRRGVEDAATPVTVELGAGRTTERVPVKLEPKEAGDFVYTAWVTTPTGEKGLANNSKHFPLRVDANAIGVLYFEGFMRYEYKFLRQRLEDDPDIQLVTALRRTNPARPAVTTSRVTITPELLENTDLVILGDMESDYLTPAEYQTLSSWIEKGNPEQETADDRRSHSLLVLGGYHSFGPDGFSQTPLAEVLPVVFAADGIRQSEDPFVLELTENGIAHPIFRLASDSVQNTTMWQASPPLLGSSLVQRAKAGAEILAVNPGFRFDNQPAVVIATGRYGAGQTMVITADTTWRWTRVARIVGRSDSLYARFWSQTIRWLTGRDLEQKRAAIVVSTDRPDYDVSKPVSIKVVRQATATDAADGDVTVEVADEAGQRQAVPMRTGSAEPNVFQGQYFPQTGGRYEVHAQMSAGGQPSANQTTEFLVHGSELELAETGTNQQLLKSISNRSGGAYVDIEEIDQLAGSIDRKERRISRVQRSEYWNAPPLFVLFLLAITSEWMLRRRNHLV
ncbi:MAG: hypothetical protein CMJ75_05190 [Planctomycetaceae bacterium]|nr:hypothetical protein [Planctomycetaceae bacterium]